MKCPQCSGVLVTLEFDRIEIDYCPQCEGIWLDSGELGLLLEREEGEALSRKAPESARSKERKLKCPICSKGMEKVLVDGSDVLLDECPAHGLWFDRGELKKLIQAGCAAENHEKGRGDSLVRILEEVFPPGYEERT